MRLTALSLRNFRNHTESEFHFADRANVLLGDNGQGKTTVLEAISYLCLTKSFYAGSDADVVNFHADLFEVEGTFISDGDVRSQVRTAYEKGTARKAVLINSQPVEKFSEVIGRYPVVISSPDHAPITMGSPAERRRFADFVISQASRRYLATLVEYRRALRQRNKILTDAKVQQFDANQLLGPWDEQLVRSGAFVMAQRGAFAMEFTPFLLSAHRELTGGEEIPAIRYVPFGQADDGWTEDDFRRMLSDGLHEKRSIELRLGSTLSGPHRDEFAFSINGYDLRKHASQGQHKTFLVALKIAEFYYLNERCHEMPILLLDDIFSELDERRAVRLLGFVGNLSQTFITSTTLHVFDSMTGQPEQGRIFHLQEGRTVEQSPFSMS